MSGNEVSGSEVSGLERLAWIRGAMNVRAEARDVVKAIQSGHDAEHGLHLVSFVRRATAHIANNEWTPEMFARFCECFHNELASRHFPGTTPKEIEAQALITYHTYLAELADTQEAQRAQAKQAICDLQQRYDTQWSPDQTLLQALAPRSQQPAAGG